MGNRSTKTESDYSTNFDRILDNNMGNRSTKTYHDNTIKFDRILDAEYEIYVGIGKGYQVIRLGDYTKEYHKLSDFSEENDKLTYIFENDVKMTLQKSGNNIHMIVEDFPNKRIISKKMDPLNIQYFKPISLYNMSDEIDKMHDLFSRIERPSIRDVAA